MMHGREKSDSAIVAGKPTNNVERSTAVPAEPRVEAEGNTSQQSTCRAQDRESVSQALERIRQAARQRKKERFTSLFHHLSIELLRQAFSALKREAAPGVDGLTWRDYEADLDGSLVSSVAPKRSAADHAFHHSGIFSRSEIVNALIIADRARLH